MKDDNLIKGAHARNARAKLLLVPCTDPTCTVRDCPNHGYVVMELDGDQATMGEVRTRAEAYAHLMLFKEGVPGHSPQPEFLSAVRQADWLTGDMPSALFTPAGTRQGDVRGKVTVVPMDSQVVNGLIRARGATPAEDRWRMNRLMETFSR